LGTAELTAFFHVDGVVKNSGSSSGTINTTFAAPDLSFDYLAAGEQLNITYAVQLDDHAGGISTQNVMVTVIGTNDKPVFLCGPDTEHLAEGQHVDPSGNLTADGDLLFSDVDLSDTHTVSTTVTASRSGGGAVPIPTPPCWRHFPPRLVRTRPAIFSAKSTGNSRLRTRRSVFSTAARR
jgi:VCBS repeat-containing protein